MEALEAYANCSGTSHGSYARGVKAYTAEQPYPGGRLQDRAAAAAWCCRPRRRSVIRLADSRMTSRRAWFDGRDRVALPSTRHRHALTYDSLSALMHHAPSMVRTMQSAPSPCGSASCERVRLWTRRNQSGDSPVGRRSPAGHTPHTGGLLVGRCVVGGGPTGSGRQ